jgi:hypothetical protein
LLLQTEPHGVSFGVELRDFLIVEELLHGLVGILNRGKPFLLFLPAVLITSIKLLILPFLLGLFVELLGLLLLGRTLELLLLRAGIRGIRKL